VHHVRYSSGLGMANHVGAGDGLRATAFLPTAKVSRRRPHEMLNSKEKSHEKTTSLNKLKT